MGTSISAGAGVRKQERPMPNRSHSLWRQCLYACAAGWNKGWDDTNGATTYEDQQRTRGILQGSRAGTHTLIDAGRALASGVSLDPINWATVLNSYQSGNGVVSAAILFRLIATGTPGTGRALFSKSVDFGNQGWRIQVESNTTFRFEMGTGAAKVNVDWNPAGGQSLTRSYMIVATYDRSNLRIYGNGALVGGPVAAAGSLSDSTADMRFFAPSTDGTPPNANISMAAAWNRVLNPGEVATLFSDPYVMWRTTLHKEFMFGPGLSNFQTFFTNFG